MQGTIVEGYSIQSGLEFVKEYDFQKLLKSDDEGWEENTRKRMQQNAIVGIAAMVLNFRKGLADTDLAWARGVINKTVSVPFDFDECSMSDLNLILHSRVFASKAIASEIRFGTADDELKFQLLLMIASPANGIAISALNICISLFYIDKKLAYSAIFLALSMSHKHLIHRIYNSENNKSLKKELQDLDSILADYFESENKVIEFPQCGNPWTELDEEDIEPFPIKSQTLKPITLKRSEEQWDTDLLSEILKVLPIKQLIESELKKEFLSFIDSLLSWTIELVEPSWDENYDFRGNRSSLYQFTDALGNTISIICGELPFNETFDRFVQPILALQTKEGWELIQPLISYLSCHLYDEVEVSNDVIRILERCLERFLQEDEFDQNGYKLNRFDLFKTNTLKSLMFTSIGTFKGAKRFANGDWSDIHLILPIIDKLVREAGWISSVIHNYIELCENAEEYYPAELFADQVLTTISQPKLVGSQGSTLYSRIAELVQFFAERDNPLNLVTGQKLLRIIDWLIDQGDRRSASLQQSELFRSIRLN